MTARTPTGTTRAFGWHPRPRRPDGPTGPAGFRRARALPSKAGPTTIGALALGWGALWLALEPSDQATGSYVGQLFGAESVLLLSISLVLISTLPWIETWFDGIDRAAIWHRRIAILGTVLLVPHILMSQNPNSSGIGRPLAIIGTLGLVALVIWAIIPRWRSVVPRGLHPVIMFLRERSGIRAALTVLGGYERWRALHRATGLFVAVGFLHGIFDGTPFTQAPLLRWSYIAIGATGLAFYLYRELLARHLIALHDYQVDQVRLIGGGLMELSLTPLGVPMTFVPGQFAMLFLESAAGWRRHPFSITSAPASSTLRFTIKALGDDTTTMQRSVQPGMPAVVRGPFGRFDHAKGGDPQLWVAGGVGIAPFLSWLRALDANPVRGQIDFFYTAADGGVSFAPEFATIAAEHPEVRIHLVNSHLAGHLTAQQMLDAVGGDPERLSVFLCGPETMVRSLQTDLRHAGVPSRSIHREYFTWR